jgi:hypothetical protein
MKTGPNRKSRLMDYARDFVLPGGLSDIDPGFMTAVLRRSGVIDRSNEVACLEESGVGMTAGYFSDIKRIRCTYRNPTGAQQSFVAKTWPAFEILPKEALRAMFLKDIKAYHFPAGGFYPRPTAILADADAATNRWALVMEDAETFSDHKVHEQEMSVEEVLRMVPKLVDVAVTWEGCDNGPKADMLADLGVDLWASDANLGLYKSVMPGGAKLFDRLTTMADSSLIVGATWDRDLGPRICELFTKRLDAFFADAHPTTGATCTLSHGDLRGDNIFFCEPNERYPDGWLCIDFQLMFRGPVPSDLAYIMGTGTVLPEVYVGENLHRVLHAFYERFMAKTTLYKTYRYEQFEREFAMMSTVHFVYAVGMGAAIWQAGAFANERAARIELGGQGVTEADLAPEELRQRMWWRKLIANYRQNFKTFGQYARLRSLPENVRGLGPWAELPSHL